MFNVLKNRRRRKRENIVLRWRNVEFIYGRITVLTRTVVRSDARMFDDHAIRELQRFHLNLIYAFALYMLLSLSLSLSRRADESKVHFESRRSRQFQHRPHHASYFRSRFFALEDLRVLTSSLNDLAASAILQSYILVKRKLMETFRNF